MLADKNLLKGNGDIRASISALMTNASRARNGEDPYTWNDYARDMANGAMMTNNVVGISALAGAAATGSPILATVGTVTGTIGAMQFAYNVIKNRMKRS